MGFFKRSHSCIKYTLIIFNFPLSCSITPFIYSFSKPSFFFNVLSRLTQITFKTVYGAYYYELKRGKTAIIKIGSFLKKPVLKIITLKFCLFKDKKNKIINLIYNSVPRNALFFFLSFFLFFKTWFIYVALAIQELTL